MRCVATQVALLPGGHCRGPSLPVLLLTGWWLADLDADADCRGCMRCPPMFLLPAGSINHYCDRSP